MGRNLLASARSVLAIAVLLGCGRVGFELPDAGIDGGPRQLVCSGNEPCSLACVGEPCGASCESGSSCAVAGEGGARLDVTCEDGAACMVTTDQVDRVSASCAVSASCQVDCDDAESCELTCAAGASCELSCPGTESCRMRCEEGAACTLRCPPWWQGRCALEGCPDEQRMECGDRVLTCGVACPG
jgi:hypothetical protein